MNTLIIHPTNKSHCIILEPGYSLAAAGCIKLGCGQPHVIMIRIDVDHLSIESIAN